MNTWTPKNVAIAAGVVLVVGWYIKNKAGDTLKQAGQAVNPVNNDNVINQGAQSLWGVFTDGKGSIGTDIYDWLNPGDELNQDQSSEPTRPNRQGL